MNAKLSFSILPSDLCILSVSPSSKDRCSLFGVDNAIANLILKVLVSHVDRIGHYS